MCSPWFELTLLFGLTCVGQIVFARFEERTPIWRKLLKTVAFALLAVWITTQFGRVAFFSVFGLMVLAVVVVHAWWLPSKGVNGWTGEPKERYYQLRGWKYPS